MNSTIQIGRIATDPSDMKYTPSGVAVLQFRIAVDRRKKEDGEKKSDFFDVVAWRQSAEYLSQYGEKGLRVAVHGRLEEQKWINKETQKQRSKVVIVAENVTLLDYAKQERSEAPGQSVEPEAEEDIFDWEE